MKRDIAIDYLRSVITTLVVAHHAALAYNAFSRYVPEDYMRSTAPVVDAARWMPLDILVAWNDLFFMPLMFLISGFFVVPSLGRKGAGGFLSDRAKRLGVPFLLSAAALGPLAYYPSWLLSDPGVQGVIQDIAHGGVLGEFLHRFYTVDGWSCGPAWFIWVLLAFCGLVAVVSRVVPKLLARWSWTPRSPRGLVAAFLAASLLAAIPMRIFISPADWFQLVGPLHFQTWRIALYFVWFVLGIALGSANLTASLSRENLKCWPLWLALGALTYVTHAFLEAPPLACLANLSSRGLNVLQAVAYSCCCTFTGLGALGMARSCFHTARSWADSLTDNAYGIYIFHYAFVTWSQFVLLSRPLPGAVKFLVVFSFALAASWLFTSLLRRTGAKKFL